MQSHGVMSTKYRHVDQVSSHALQPLLPSYAQGHHLGGARGGPSPPSRKEKKEKKKKKKEKKKEREKKKEKKEL